MKTSTIQCWGACFSVILLCGITNAQISFTNANSRLNASNANIRSGNSLTVVDVNNDDLDDILILDQNQYAKVSYQQPGGNFNQYTIGDFGGAGPWGMSSADVDHNGYKDVLCNGGGGPQLMKLNGTGTGMLGGIITLPNGAIFSQNGNFMDVNNDGWEDIFMCNDVDESRIWVNNGSGSFPAEAMNSVIDFDIHPGTSAPNDESGNYSSVWTDFDNDGDVDFFIAHCRQGVSPGDVRRDDVLFQNNGDGTYTSNGPAYNLASNDQDWVGSYGDIDNDGDFDLLLVKHDVISRYYFNDGAGHMTVSPNTIAFGNMPMQSQFEDLDNDGFVDMLITGDNDHKIYHNNGDGTFTDQTPSNWVVSGKTILSFATGDLNHDGKIDVYTSYGSTYNNPSASIDDIYYLNTTPNNNNFVTLDLRGTLSTDGALGARAYIYGAWGVQTREVRASESYGTCNSFHLHFGLGTATSIDSIVVNWPATGSANTVIINPTINQFIQVTEGTCVSPTNVITYTGSPVICSPGTFTLNASTGAGYTYLWSNGATTSSINASVGGEYSVRVTAPGNACKSWSKEVTVTVDPVEIPTVTADGPTTFCQGGSVNLTSSETSNNTWNTSQTTQTINVTTPGSYTVDFAGVCTTWTSSPVIISTLSIPSAPVTTDDVIPSPGTGTLTATGSIIKWYTASSGGTLVGTGSPFTTPVVSTLTTYYAEDQTNSGVINGNIGQVNHAGTDYNGSTYNGYLVFDVTNNSTLNTVKVYSNTAGNRLIELRNSFGTVLNSLVVNIPADTTVINLNFPLTPGTGYQLGTNGAANIPAFGGVSPVLMRSTSGVSYPYMLAGGAVSITSSSAGGSNYYYFYDWNVTVDPLVACPSTRTAATVHVLTGIENNNEIKLSVYPNPASEFINIEFTSPVAGEAMVSIFDMLGKKIYDVNLGNVNGNVIRTINTATYAKGIYNVQLTVNNKNYTTRIVIK
jgi:hypothetical protein